MFQQRDKKVINNSDKLSIHQETNITGLGPVPLSENSITYLVSMAILIDTGFRVFFDLAIKNAIFLFINNNIILKFERSDNGLYFHDTENRQVYILNSQFENIFNYTKRQIRNEKKQGIFTRSFYIHQ